MEWWIAGQNLKDHGGLRVRLLYCSSRGGIADLAAWTKVGNSSQCVMLTSVAAKLKPQTGTISRARGTRRVIGAGPAFKVTSRLRSTSVGCRCRRCGAASLAVIRPEQVVLGMNLRTGYNWSSSAAFYSIVPDSHRFYYVLGWRSYS